MRRYATMTVVAVVLAAGLTGYGNPQVRPLGRDYLRRLGTMPAQWVGRVTAGLERRFRTGTGEYQPGPTCALLLSDGFIVGLDREGYVTYREAGFASDLAAITGSDARCDIIGQRITDPSVSLGLSIVRAFNSSEDLPELLSEVNVADPENPKVILCGGITVEIGTGDYRTKTGRLHQILLQAPSLGVYPDRVDMRFGRQVVVEYRKTKTQARKEV
jgi:hypothetical protein